MASNARPKAGENERSAHSDTSIRRLKCRAAVTRQRGHIRGCRAGVSGGQRLSPRTDTTVEAFRPHTSPSRCRRPLERGATRTSRLRTDGPLRSPAVKIEKRATAHAFDTVLDKRAGRLDHTWTMVLRNL